jgi:hypothetical protein
MQRMTCERNARSKSERIKQGSYMSTYNYDGLIFMLFRYDEELRAYNSTKKQSDNPKSKKAKA